MPPVRGLANDRASDIRAGSTQATHALFDQAPLHVRRGRPGLSVHRVVRLAQRSIESAGPGRGLTAADLRHRYEPWELEQAREHRQGDEGKPPPRGREAAGPTGRVRRCGAVVGEPCAGHRGRRNRCQSKRADGGRLSHPVDGGVEYERDERADECGGDAEIGRTL